MDKHKFRSERVVIGDKGVYMDGFLRKNLHDVKESIKDDDDALIIVDGKERIGKSVLALTLAWYLSDGKLTLDDICLTPQEFSEAVKKAPKYRVLVFDEAFLGFASEDSLRNFNKLLKKMLVTCGQKNLILILVLPSVFDLNKYTVLHRGDILVHCYKNRGERGYFLFYNHTKLQQLYIYGKKTYQYKVKSDFYGRYVKFYPIDEEAYRQKKAVSLDNFLDTIDVTATEGKETRTSHKAIALLHLKYGMAVKDLKTELEIHPNTIYRAIRKYKPHLVGV